MPITPYPEAFAINGAHRVAARAMLSLPHYQVDCKRGAVAVYSAKITFHAWSVDITDLSPDTSNDLPAINGTRSAQAMLSPRAAVGRIDSKAVTSSRADRPQTYTDKQCTSFYHAVGPANLRWCF